MEPSSELAAFARAVSRLLGWSYFLIWSVSYYPQCIKNYRLGTTKGQSIDFSVANVVGMTAYVTANAAFLFSEVVRSQYRQRHRGSEPTVRANDLVYSVHGLLLILVNLSQFVPSIWGLDVGKWQRPGRIMVGICALSVCIVLASMAAQAATHSHGEAAAAAWAWVDVVNTLGYIKVLLTTVKYVPQVHLNYRRKSTVGWSIAQILQDFTGGILSLLQLVIDASLQGDWTGVTGNPAKFGLANVTLVFDIIFIIQHYVLYRHADKIDEAGAVIDAEQEPLLSSRNAT